MAIPAKANPVTLSTAINDLFTVDPLTSRDE
jgi:hypothetical protein